ncbi:hypothetical protein AXG93_879s1060 [Marchantia polymorpha subsp. ruderalis]|uniref:Uncharacterized protein n=1 Tax=Marchantia polymorpha subsp. ruderalis TaxID=1480154 RepID=A0A176WUE8_MARPO|nr:hypothetical protein AXG93_879s1060 [Marchantia polymorpha subsp. ruderalis]
MLGHMHGAPRQLQQQQREELKLGIGVADDEDDGDADAERPSPKFAKCNHFRESVLSEVPQHDGTPGDPSGPTPTKLGTRPR